MLFYCGKTIDFFKEQKKKYAVKSIGVASFGPIDLNPESKTYGFITSTPKPGWKDTDLIGQLEKELGLPCAFDTDVNGAALAEYRWGNPDHVKSLVYYTIGTGVGAGVVINGVPLHGMLHPEAGHVLIRRDPERIHIRVTAPSTATVWKVYAAGLPSSTASANQVISLGKSIRSGMFSRIIWPRPVYHRS